MLAHTDEGTEEYQPNVTENMNNIQHFRRKIDIMMAVFPLKI